MAVEHSESAQPPRDAKAIEGRWWLDFTRQPALDPAGNEFVLTAGVVNFARTGECAGTYQIESAWLIMTLPMPSISDDGQWRMEAKLLLTDPSCPPERLPGLMQIFDGDGEVFTSGSCFLVRRRMDA